MKPTRKLSFAVLGTLAALSVGAMSAPALAKDKYKWDHGNNGQRGNAPVVVVQGGNCPPGLAKKGSCIPPGHRKHWGHGEYIPREVVYHRVSYREYGLPRPRYGETYVRVDSDVYLIAEATRLVLTAIALNSN